LSFCTLPGQFSNEKEKKQKQLLHGKYKQKNKGMESAAKR